MSLIVIMTQSPSAIGALHLNINYFALLIGTVNFQVKLSVISSPPSDSLVPRPSSCLGRGLGMRAVTVLLHKQELKIILYSIIRP